MTPNISQALPIYYLIECNSSMGRCCYYGCIKKNILNKSLRSMHTGKWRKQDLNPKLGMVTQACGPVIQGLKQDDCEFVASLGYLMRL